MAYTPTEWQIGDVITAEKLNKAERGIAEASPVIVEITPTGESTASANMTGSEVYRLLAGGYPVQFHIVSDDGDKRERVLLPTEYSNENPEEESFGSILLSTIPDITTSRILQLKIQWNFSTNDVDMFTVSRVIFTGTN